MAKRYQRSNQNPQIEEQTTQWPKEKVEKDKQWSTKHTYKTKDQVTRTTLKKKTKRTNHTMRTIMGKNKILKTQAICNEKI